MQELSLKEVIESLKEEVKILKWVRDGMGVSSQKTQDKLRNHPKLKDDYIRGDKRIEAIEIAISKLQLFEQVERVGVKKKVIHLSNKSPHPDVLNDCEIRREGFNNAIDLCNAEWVEKLEKIIAEVNRTKQELINEINSYPQYPNLGKKGCIKRLETLILHLNINK